MQELTWWHKSIIYQIYPRSFHDSNNDGIGDLKGIISKLDYLQWLGVNAVWISPIYPSPMADFGYDITDYKGVDPIFGTMSDFDELLQKAHEKGIKVILDLVPNHTSDQHPWFLESRSSRDNPKRDWYIWKDADAFGGPPNNWLANFGGRAWEWDEKTKQYYYHAFLKEQPDLNWRNPEVQKAIFDVMRFWFGKGVDGFRIDVLWHLIKDEHFRDNPLNPDYIQGMRFYRSQLPVYSADQDDVLDIVKKMRDVAEEYKDKLLIGEIYLPVERLIRYYGQEGKGIHLPFNFQLIMLEWEPDLIFHMVNRYEQLLGKKNWPNWVLGNHDNSRIASRVGRQQARVAAVLLLTLRGTITLYYGDEIGMSDVFINTDEIVDPQGKSQPQHNRDKARTPMQWNNNVLSGFTKSIQPWLPVATDYQNNNVESEKKEPGSMLSLYKSLIELRNKEPALSEGHYEPVLVSDSIIAYKRIHNKTQLLIILNLTHAEAIFDPGFPLNGSVILHTNPSMTASEINGNILLKGDEAMIIRLHTN